MGIRELYNISEIGNSPSLFYLESVNVVSTGGKRECVASVLHANEERKKLCTSCV